MAEFRELIYALNDVRRGDFADDDFSSGRSIFTKAEPAILNFPVICSDLISLEDLTMVNKALEREYATVVRLAMGLDNVNNEGNITDYIKRFHTNTYTSDTRSATELFSDVLDESMKIAENFEISDNIIEDMYLEDLGLNLDNLNDKTIVERPVLNEDSPHNVPNYSLDFKDGLVDNDIKKANELIPTTLNVSFYYNTRNAGLVKGNMLLGIKCTSHKVDSDVMIENIYNAVEHKKNFFRFIQWTTGEIKFFKDYLLCLDTLKKEALNSHDKKNGDSYAWFRTLKTKATLSKIKRGLRLKDTLIPNSTLVISMDEVDKINDMYNIDLIKNLTVVNQLMDTFFLIGFVIVDAGAEIAYFKFDAFPKYQIHSFRSLERENRNVANDVKAITTLMSKF